MMPLNGYRRFSIALVGCSIIAIPACLFQPELTERQATYMPTENARIKVQRWLAEAPFDDPKALAARPNFSYEEWFERGRSLPESVATLVELLQREDLAHPSGNGMRTAYALGWIGDKRRSVVDALLRCLGSKDATLRAEAAAALGRQGDATVLPTLEKLLTNKAEEVNVRANACIAIGRLRVPSSEALLKQTLHDSDPFLVRCAEEALRLLSGK